MARGPKPAPAAVKAQKAPIRSTKVRADEAAEAEVPESGLKAPAWLKGDGLAIWSKRAPMMRAARLLQAADELAFARYCRNLALWVKMRNQLDRVGYVYKSKSNHGELRRADPAFLVADRIERQLLAAEDRFGMNPAERQRIFAARAQKPGGDLFEPHPATQREGDPASAPSAASAPMEAPTGFLN